MIDTGGGGATAVALLMQVLSALGLLLLVVAFVLNSRGMWRPESRAYLLFNAVGALLLTIYSIWIREWVFVALEAFWSLMSIYALISHVRADTPTVVDD